VNLLSSIAPLIDFGCGRFGGSVCGRWGWS